MGEMFCIIEKKSQSRLILEKVFALIGYFMIAIGITMSILILTSLGSLFF